MSQENNMEQVVLRFTRKKTNADGAIIMEPEEIQSIVQMLYATYNKVNQLCAAMHRQEHERAAGSNSPYASRNPFL